MANHILRLQRIMPENQKLHPSSFPARSRCYSYPGYGRGGEEEEGRGSSGGVVRGGGGGAGAVEDWRGGGGGEAGVRGEWRRGFGEGSEGKASEEERRSRTKVEAAEMEKEEQRRQKNNNEVERIRRNYIQKVLFNASYSANRPSF